MTPRHPHRQRFNPFRWVDEKEIGKALTRLAVLFITAAIPAGAVAINSARTQAADRKVSEEAIEAAAQSRAVLQQRVDSLVVALKFEKRRRMKLERAVYRGRIPDDAFFGPPEPPPSKPNIAKRLFRFFKGG